MDSASKRWLLSATLARKKRSQRNSKAKIAQTIAANSPRASAKVRLDSPSCARLRARRDRLGPAQVEGEFTVPVFEHGGVRGGQPFNECWRKRRLCGN